MKKKQLPFKLVMIMVAFIPMITAIVFTMIFSMKFIQNLVLDEIEDELAATVMQADMHFKEMEGDWAEIDGVVYHGDEEIKEELKDVVNKRCILGYVLNKISEKEKITVSEADINAALNAEISRNPRNAQNIIDYYTNNPGALDFKKAEILERKVIDFLLTKTTGEEVKKTKEELEKTLGELWKDDEV